ncbi:hypothetical protein QE250_01520 [Chromatiaceae bacterium AAb-1]|jgi:hypothetical protein|nr:hypothetical protein [Chromatiaceae bacterium AAb-1]
MKTCCLLLLLLFPPLIQAQFHLPGQVKLESAEGVTAEFPFGFSYIRQEGSYRFTAGSQHLTVSQVPQKFSLVLVPEPQQVWVPDLFHTPLKGFEWQLAEHHIRLFRDTVRDSKNYGAFVLLVNGERYLFHRGQGQIQFFFDEQGISEITVRGMLKPARS